MTPIIQQHFFITADKPKDLIENPEELICLFKKHVFSKEHTPSTLKHLFKCAAYLAKKDKFNKEQIENIMCLYLKQFPNLSQTRKVPETDYQKLEKYALHFLDQNITCLRTLYTVLEASTKIGNCEINNICLQRLARVYEIDIDMDHDQNIVYLEIKSPKIGFKELSEELIKLSQFFTIIIELSPILPCNKDTLTLFIKEQGASIDFLDLEELSSKVDEDLLKNVIKSCSNLRHLNICSEEINNESLESLFKLESLKNLFLKSSKITELPKLPKNLIKLNLKRCTHLESLTNLPSKLEHLDLSKCHELKKLPPIPTTLKTIKLFKCIKILQSYRLQLLIEIFTRNIKQGLQLYPGFYFKECKDFGRQLFKILTLESIKAYFNEIKKVIPIKALQFLIIPVINQDFDFFLENLNNISLIHLSREVLDQIPIWTEFNSSKINKEKWFINEKVKWDDPSLTLSDISLNDILDRFDKINFSNPEESDYINPDYLTIDGSLATIEELKNGIQMLILHTEKKDNHLAVPKDEEKRNEWYLQLTNMLKAIVLYSKQHENQRLVSHELIRLGMAGHACGSRWIKESADILTSLKNQPLETQSIDKKILNWIDVYTQGVLQEMTLKYAGYLGNSMQPHVFNYIAKIMKQKGFKFPKNRTIDFNDNLVDDDYFSKNEIEELIESYFIPTKIVKFIQNMIQEELNSNPMLGEILLIPINEYAESKLKEEISLIERKTKKLQLEYGIQKVKYLHKDSMMAQAILEERHDLIENFKKSHRLEFIQIKQNLTKTFYEAENSKKRKAETDSFEESQRQNKKRKIENSVEMEDSKLIKLKEVRTQINHFEQLLQNPYQFQKELLKFGNQKTEQEIRFKKENLISNFLESQKLLTLSDRDGSIHLTLKGTLILLQWLNILVKEA